MTTFPSFCPWCETIFESRILEVGPSGKGLRISNCKEPCPNCGKQASMVEGLFDIVDGVLQVVSGPPLTSAVVAQFAALIRDGRDQKITLDELETEAGKLDPKLGEVVSKVRGHKSMLWTLLAVVILALQNCSVDVNIALDANQLIEQLSGHPTEQVLKDWITIVNPEPQRP